MKLIKTVLVFSLFSSLIYLCYYPIALEPVARKTPPYPGLSGQYEVNTKLAKIDLVKVPSPGPESIVRHPAGHFFAGLANGDILQFNSTGKDQKIIANTGGRPLGMKIAPNGDLIIADQIKGLLQLDSTLQIKVLVKQYEGEDLKFIDDLDISAAGVVYFSNATQRNPIVVENEAWEQRASGALFAYDLNTTELRLLKKDLFFANGVALHHSEDYFVFSETFGLTLSKFWLKGPKKGTTELFNDQLPGFPDNVTYNKGIFWVAIPTQRVVGIEPLFERPFLRSILLRLPESVRNAVLPKRYAMLLGFNEAGKVIYNLQDPNGKYDYITSVLNVENTLYIGSLKEPTLGIYPLNQ